MNIKGELIGINTAIFTRGGGSNGVGFAIPANLVKVFLAAAESGQKSFERPYIGATFEPVTSDVADALGLDKVRGALVLKIVPGGPAAAAGLKPGEVVTAVNGISVEHPDALGYRLTTAGLGGAARLAVQSGGKEREVTIKLDTAPETVPRDQTEIAGRSPFTGMTVGNLSPRLAGELSLPAEKTGVAVIAVKDGTPAVRLGFKPKDIIVSVNGSPVTSVDTMQGLIDDDPSVWRIEIERDGQRLTQFFR
jgi:S1-C subfamily serine protease